MKGTKWTAPSAGLQPHKLPFTDVGNAQRLIAKHGRYLRYCPAWGKWLVWDEARWAPDKDYEVERLAKATIRDLHRVVAQMDDEDKRRLLARHIVCSESGPRIKHMIEMAKSEPGVPVLPDQLDADPWVINVRNGTLDLHTGVLQPHRREGLLTKLAPIAYDPQAACPTWRNFLQRILGADEELMRFVQKRIGYSLTGSTQEQCFFTLYGVRANGKSTFLNAVSVMLGDYTRHTPSETLPISRSDSVRNDLARLQGARLVGG
jgi:putative DNA primase/helicase